MRTLSSGRLPLSTFLFLVLSLFVLTVRAETGPEVAQLLNTRYRNTPLDCPGNHAAYFCSGVLVSDLAGGLVEKFWEHTPTAKTLGARSFSYLRSDLGIRTLTQTGGMVFFDPFTAISQGKAVDVLCAYPLTANILQGLYGCGTGGSEADPASCPAQGVSDVPGWLAHFQQQGQDPLRQCSLSSRIPAQFRASLLAHEQLGGGWVTQPNKLMVRNWDERAPAQVPVQALFYNLNQSAGLRVAENNQRDYYKATGQWLPILRLNLAGADGVVFEFSLQDQLYVGYEVADRLNARYFDTAVTCPDGRASLYCNGVIVRGTAATTQYHSWNPNPTSITVSTSYVRADAHVIKPLWPQGFLFKEQGAPTAQPLTVRCAYPIDAGTTTEDACTFNGVCEQLGINSVATWLARYAHFAYNICSFTTAPEQIQLSLDIRGHLDQVAWHQFQDWNEFMVGAWPQNIPEQLPIDALFYGNAYYNGNGPVGARFIQDDYFKVTGRFLPIVHLRLDATDRQIFSFTPDDQCLADSCPPPPQALGSQGTASWFREHGQ
ncbi:MULTISPECIES: hypothetical protein [Pseudomonas]|uniref:hypothetical protein n=1 Tax=Pseudomonas TaxID=286 RepID=UPI001FF16610|nr:MULTISPECIES: hypothetical protein [Pseudomonas]